MALSADRPILRAWRELAATDVLYKAIAFAILAPSIVALGRLLIRRTGASAVTDVDIALFFFTTKTGVLALVLIGALAIAVTALEQACLMTIALGALRGTRLRVRDAFAHGVRCAFPTVRLTAFLVLRIVAIVAPFAAVLGLTYWALLGKHDINFYLTDKPPSFWGAAAIVAVVGAALLYVIVRVTLSWLLALPIVVFEGVLPVLAFGESSRRMKGRRKRALKLLAVWAAVAIGLPLIVNSVAHVVGRAIAPAFSGTLAGFLIFVGFFALIWGAATLLVGIVTAALFASIVVRVYDADGGAPAAKLPGRFNNQLAIEGWRWNVSYPVLAATLAGGVIVTSVAAYLIMRSAWTDRPVAIIAHRGASAEAPENTLAAFRLAGVQRTDYVELDVQESQDGVVVVIHDSDLMKVGRSPLKIWEATADQLRAVDIGSHLDARFKDERVPTLAEALAACKGVSRVDIELKDYGHDQRLEERVVELVEAAGMENDIVTMSLSHDMVGKMKRLRPSWTSGLLTAKALGDMSRMHGDFLAVEKAMATRRFIWAAHRAGKPVYVWTVDDPATMIRLIGFGVDGLITNYPGVAREVLERYRKMSQAQRLFVFAMTRLGAHEDVSASSDLRP